MQRKERFPPEPDTQPDVLRAKSLAKRQSVAAPKKSEDRREAPTEPPPPPKKRLTLRPPKGTEDRTSGMRARRPLRSEAPAATVDEVVADMSRDPRRERDEDE
jgi:hypothetical protein